MSAQHLDYPKLAFDAIDEFDRKHNARDVIDHMSKTLAGFGFDSFLVASIPNAPEDQLQQISLMDGWPVGWSERYEKKEYFKFDPVANHGLKSLNPFKWSDVRFDRTNDRQASEVMNTASDFGLKEGFSIPIVRHESVDVVTMAGDRPDYDPLALRAIHLIGLYAHSKALGYLRKSGKPSRKPILTVGERETLTWVAAGKSSWEISVILKISEATVVWRIQRASMKLNAVNRMQAVVNAIRAKEINV